MLNFLSDITIFKIKCNVLSMSILYSYNLNQIFYYTTPTFILFYLPIVVKATTIGLIANITQCEFSNSSKIKKHIKSI